MILYLSLFIFGVTTFISPCSIGLVSVYLTYTLRNNQNRGQGIIVGISYVIAMSMVFFIFGYLISSLIPVNLASSKVFYIFTGALMIVFGLNNLGVLERFRGVQNVIYDLSDQSNNLRTSLISKIGKRGDFTSSFLFGIIISIALGPCSLALIFPAVMMSLFNAPSAIYGGFQLLAFGVGHSFPVLILSVLLAQTRLLISKNLTEIGGTLNIVMGIGFLVLGFWLIFEAVNWL